MRQAAGQSCGGVSESRGDDLGDAPRHRVHEAGNRRGTVHRLRSQVAYTHNPTALLSKGGGRLGHILHRCTSLSCALLVVETFSGLALVPLEEATSSNITFNPWMNVEDVQSRASIKGVTFCHTGTIAIQYANYLPIQEQDPPFTR